MQHLVRGRGRLGRLLDQRQGRAYGGVGLALAHGHVSRAAQALGNLSPTDNTYEANYKANIYNWQSVALRYVKLEMSGCPQTQPASNILTVCGIGEVAFNAAPTTAVPELNPIGMGALGLGLMALGLRRRRHQG